MTTGCAALNLLSYFQRLIDHISLENGCIDASLHGGKAKRVTLSTTSTTPRPHGNGSAATSPTTKVATRMSQILLNCLLRCFAVRYGGIQIFVSKGMMTEVDLTIKIKTTPDWRREYQELCRFVDKTKSDDCDGCGRTDASP